MNASDSTYGTHGYGSHDPGPYGQTAPYSEYRHPQFHHYPRYDPYGQYGQFSELGQYGEFGQYDEGSERGPWGVARPRAGRLWAGGVAVAVVAALTAAVALLLVRGVLGLPVFAPERDGALVLVTTGSLALGAAAAALLGTAVLQLLSMATPRPGRFLAWIVSLATLAMMLLPFASRTGWEAGVGTAAVYLVIGVAIGSLLATVGRTALRR